MRARNWREVRFVITELLEVYTGEEWEELWKE